MVNCEQVAIKVFVWIPHYFFGFETLSGNMAIWYFASSYEILKSFKRGNHLFGVHINSIKGKDGFTKTSGPNPLSYVGVTFSASGLTATLWEVVGGKWVEYDKIDGSASYQVEVSQEYRGKALTWATGITFMTGMPTTGSRTLRTG